MKNNYIVYLEHYCWNKSTKKMGEFDSFSLAKEYIWRIKDNFAGKFIELIIKYAGQFKYSLDCYDGCISESCVDGNLSIF